MTQLKHNLERIYRDLSAGLISKQEALDRISALKSAPPGDSGVLMSVPIWRASVAGSPDMAWAERHVMVCELPGVAKQPLEALVAGSRCLILGRPAKGDLAQRYGEYALACFERIKQVLSSKVAGAVLMQVVVSEDAEHAVFAGLSALLKTASLENPQFRGQVVLSRSDITTAGLAQQLEQAQAHASEPVIRFERGTQPMGLGWQVLPEAVAEPVFKEHGVYLITGGLGGLGMLFAQSILEQTRHGRVVLTGRGGLSAEKQARLDALKAHGAGRVEYRAVDLGDLSQVEALVARVMREHGGLHGVLHSAGMIADNFILKKTAQEFVEVLAPKVSGTWHLDDATRGLQLDFFALFSSVASAFGNVGQSDYAAANGFLDAFAKYRNGLVSTGERHGRTVSIHWSLWQSGGMQLDAVLQSEIERATGMRPLSTANGLQAFHRSVVAGHHRIVVMEGVLETLRRTLDEAAPEWLTQPAAVSESLDDEDLIEKTQDWLRRRFSVLLKLSSHRIDPQAQLEQYGIDSILAMRLTSELEKTFGVLSKTLFFEYRTIADLADHMVASHPAVLNGLFAKGRAGALPDVPAIKSVADAKFRSPSRSLPVRPLPSPMPVTGGAGFSVEPIAIVGLSGRYPEAPDLATYWTNLRDGKDCIVEVPPERWDWRDYFTEDRTQSGHHYSRWGGFITGVDEFDPQFFNIAPREAKQIDPQERLFLQHAWMAVEDAGYSRASLRSNDVASSDVGVYVGVMYSEYQLFGAEASLRGQRMGLAGSFASIANRVSYALDLHGPSMTLDTMCSSSLTAIHLACQDLRLGRTRLAIAGGVNVTIHPNKYLVLSSGQFISSDGHCQSFGEGGDGYIPGEGVGVVLLKRLSDAQRDGDQIYGIIRGSALSHGGKTNGYTVPNPQAQTSAISQALAEAKVDARHISYIEAHGTGTKLGDPIEIAALNKAFGLTTQDRQFCLIGSAKSNIGHCESAAGIAGLTKVLLQMRHRQVVPSLHSAQLNPHIDFASSPFTVNQTLTAWEAPLVDGRRVPRIAGISSFGAGGSNAHMIVEEYVAPVQSAAVSLQSPAVIVLSARTPEQLKQKARDLLEYVGAAQGPLDLVAMAYTLQVGREAMDERLGVLVENIDALMEKLTAYLEDATEVEDLYQGQVKRHKETLSLFSSDADMQQMIDRWLTGRKLEKVLELWVKGLEVRWSRLYATPPRRMSLPTYPFAKERYWIDVTAGESAGVGATARLHPLLHANVSDLSRQAFQSTLTGKEPWLADHRVSLDGSYERVLPAVAYLEMARAAVELAVPPQSRSPVLELRNCVWVQPLVVRGVASVGIELSETADGEIDYRISSDDGLQQSDHCQGRANYVQDMAPEKIDMASLKALMNRETLASQEVYAAFTAMGLQYGPAHKAVGAVYRGEGQVLAELELPSCVRADADAYVLHPSLLDGALQASIGLTTGSGKTRMPFAVDTVRVFGKHLQRMFAWVRYAAESAADDKVAKLDIDVCDEHGVVVVQLRGLSTRTVESAPIESAPIESAPISANGESMEVLIAVPEWRVIAGTGTLADWAQRYVIACELPGAGRDDMQRLIPRCRYTAMDESSDRNLAQRYGDYALNCFEQIKAVLASKPAGAVLMQVVIGHDPEQAVLTGLSALLKSAMMENPQFRGQLIVSHSDITASALAQQLELAQAHVSETVIRFEQHSQPMALHWQRQTETGESATPFKEHGVYLITGGLGGLGVLFTQSIIENARGAQVILTGRGELSGQKRAQFDALNAQAVGRLQYRALDLDNLSLVAALVSDIVAEHGRLDGILHSAGMVADGFILKKTAAEFRDVLAPKVTGTLHLDEASSGVELDFFVLFSSIAGVFGNVGQADYATANGFLDEFAVYRNRRVSAGDRRGRTVSISWPLWQAGGMQPPVALQEQIANATGMRALTTTDGMRAFNSLLAKGYTRSLVMAGDLAKLERTLHGVSPAPASTPSTPVPSRASQPAEPVDDRTQDYLRRKFASLLKLAPQRIDPNAPLENYGIDSVLAMQLTSQLEKTFGSLSKTLFFEYQTIAALAKYLAKAFPDIVSRELGAGASAEPRHDLPPSIAQPIVPVTSRLAVRHRVVESQSQLQPQPQQDRAVAIVGLGGRYPLSEDLDAFWENLKEGRDCITEVPADRWDHAQYFDPDRNKAGKSYSKWGGFVSGIDMFDPLFFNISPKEAQLIDPQERLFLETAWQTMEDAGYDKRSLSGTRTGVYVGVMWGQYELYGVNSLAAGHVGVPSSSQASIANRVSYFFDLHGPSIAIDTMCSSSLTAIHMACEEIRRGVIDAAIAGGVNISVHPHKYLTLSQGKFVSTDGKCRSFGAGGDGYVPGEGVGAVFLKPLDHALRDGDHVYGVVRSSTINHGGKTNGYTVPNPNAQADVILAALEQAHIDPQSLSYIEAHGTGTSLGDPIEIAGLSKAFNGNGDFKQSCAIGSVKSNIGHLESAAGIAAVTKVLLQLKHDQLVPSLHAEELNPNIDFAESPFHVQTRLGPWLRQENHPRRSGVSSFGAGGSNAHLILEEHIDSRPQDRPATTEPQAFILSARDSRTLVRQAKRMADFIDRNNGLSAQDVAFTLQAGRTPMIARLAIIATDLHAFAASLRRWVAEMGSVDGSSPVVNDDDEDHVMYGNINETQQYADRLIDGHTGAAFMRELASSRDLTRLARFWIMGIEIDWTLSHVRGAPRRVSLPAYPFNKQRYWIETTPIGAGGQAMTPVPQVIDTSVAVETVKRMHYGCRWFHQPLDCQVTSPQRGGPILLLGGTDALYRGLTELRAGISHDAPVVWVRFSNVFKEIGPTEFEVRAHEEEDFQRVVSSLRSRELLPSSILLRCADADADADADAIGLQNIAATDLFGNVLALLHTSKALIAAKHASRIICVFDSDRAMPVPQHQALGGFLRTLALEQPMFSGKIIAIDRLEDDRLSIEDEIAMLMREFDDARPAVEDIHYRLQSPGRGRVRFVKQIAPIEVADTSVVNSPLKHGGVYLITGGMGGLGLLFAEYLAERYAARLVLVGRSAPTARQEQELDRLRTLSPDIIYLQGDVAKLEDVARIVGESKARFGALNGLIHSAGITRDAFVMKKTAEQMRSVFDSKVIGAMNLDLATAGENLDLFVLFSSISGVTGNVGQCDYAYANGFLDAFAERRERQRLDGIRMGRAISINWPLWKDGGMHISEEHAALMMRKTGLSLLPSAEGMQYFEEFLGSSIGQGIALFGMPEKISAYINVRLDAVASDASGIMKQPSTTDLMQRAVEYLKGLIGEEIKMDPESIDSHERLESFGLDSIMISTLNARLEHDLGELPKTMLYEHETVEEVAAFLLRHAPSPMMRRLVSEAPMAPDAPSPTIEPIPPEPTPVAVVEAPVIDAPHPRPESGATQKIAIIGVDGRHASSRNIDEFWHVLRDGMDATDIVPGDRWDAEEFFDPDPSAASSGKIYCRRGGFLADVDKFDPEFFKIPREEASVMDPQERMFLQSVWSALEDAGYTREQLKQNYPKGKSADVGVFVGVTTNSYQLLSVDAQQQGNMMMPSAMPWSIANRVSYFFDFKGPSLPVDTACSSSLVAVHMACESLRRGECQVAVAGGVNLYLHPSKYLSLCQRRMLATGEWTRSYGAGDDGFVPGEGVGSFILKPLDKAVADNDRIYGVIVGSAFDHSGRSNGYSAPNPNAQAELIDRVLRAAQVDPESIGCVEGHGTGTPLGDNLEVLALSQAFRHQTAKTQYCSLGSVKANVGHSESAAGIASMTKVLLQLKHGQLVPTLHSDDVNPDLDLPGSPFYLQHTLAPWQRVGDLPRRALVNSFGAGGVNACVVIEEYEAKTAVGDAEGPYVFALSAETQERLRDYARSFMAFLENSPETDLASLCWTLQNGREAMKERIAIIVRHKHELTDLLRRWETNGSADGVHAGRVEARRRSRSAVNDGGADLSRQELAARSAQRWVAGEDPCWGRLYENGRFTKTAAPTYPFAAERCWIAAAGVQKPKPNIERLHPLVSYNSSTLQDVSFDSWVSTSIGLEFEQSLNDAHVLPSSALLEIACACGTLAGDERICGVGNVTWAEPLRLQSDMQLIRTFVKARKKCVEYSITSLDDDGRNTVHSIGSLIFGARVSPSAETNVPIRSLIAKSTKVDPVEHYRRLEAIGLRYGPTLRSVREMFLCEDFALSHLMLADSAENHLESFVLHPAIVEGVFQSVLFFLGSGHPGIAYRPSSLEALRIVRRIPQTCHAYVKPAASDNDAEDMRRFDIDILNDQSELLAEFRGLVMQISQSSLSMMVPLHHADAHDAQTHHQRT